MSKIEKELCEVLETKPKRGEDRQDFLNRVVVGVSELGDKDWDALSQEAQDWFNDAADAKNAKKKELPDFPDAKADEPEEEEKPMTRRRGASKDDEASGPVEVKAKDVKVGMPLKIVTKRGKEATGHVVEIDDEVVVIKSGDGEEQEFDLDRVESMTTLAESKSPAKGRAKDDEVEADPIKVGATVTVVTKRGKEITGKITEMDDEILVLDVDGEEQEFDRARLDTIKPAGKPGKAKADPEAGDEKPSGRRGASKAKAEEKADDEKKPRVSNGGVSIGQRIKELIADNLDATEAEVAKLLKKEGLEFRENTLSLNYADAHKFIKILKDRKMLKA